MATNTSSKGTILKFFTPKRKRSDRSSTSSPEEIAADKKRSKESSPAQFVPTIGEVVITEMENEDLTVTIAREINRKLDTVFEDIKNKA
jgi:hypothetical protein